MPVEQDLYRVVRLSPLVQKGFLFYSIFNIRLFLYLLFHRFAGITANDLDTLLPCFLVSKIKGIPLVYDSHEFFTELPELVDRPFVRGVWKHLERWLVPHVLYASTVSRPVAEAYKDLYGIHMKVIRNLPWYKQKEEVTPKSINPAKQTVIYQGCINMGRGLETMVRAMRFLEDVNFVIVGDGYYRKEIEKLVQQENLQDRVCFTGRVLPPVLSELTAGADIGISLEEPIGLNYMYALPNKLFDYIQARIPVLTSCFPAMKEIVEKYHIGFTIQNPDPQTLAGILKIMLKEKSLRAAWKEGLEKAASELCWEQEVPLLLELYNHAGLLQGVTTDAG